MIHHLYNQHKIMGRHRIATIDISIRKGCWDLGRHQRVHGDFEIQLG